MTTQAGATRPIPAIEEEQEINFRKYWRTILVRWWLPAVGILAGLIIGYLVAIGSGKVWQASALFYPGQPLSPTGNATIFSQASNPSTVTQVVHSNAAVAKAAAESGIPVSRLKGEISVQTITGSKNLVKTGQVPLYQIQVTDRAPGKTTAAALSLANTVVARTAGYADVKITAFGAELKSINTQLAANQDRINHLNAALKSGTIPSLDRLVLVSDLDNAVTERTTLLTDQGTTQEELAVAKEVEQPKILQRPVASKTSAHSKRSSMIVAGLIGLILGVIAALLWEPLTTRFARPSSA